MERHGLDAQNITVDLEERSYNIVIGSKLLQKLGIRIKGFRPTKVAIISNTTIFPLYRA